MYRGLRCPDSCARAAERVAKRLREVTGVGELTASALLATVSDARDFKNGRQMAAWAGLVPRRTAPAVSNASA